MEQQETKFKFPTEVIELPSKGLLYPEENPLSAGKIEMKYMTAKEEDILTNQSYIQNGTVLDKLLKALIVTKINYDDIVIGDKNALMVASRILGYGADYTFKYANKTYTIDLSKIENKNFDESLITPYKNEFQFTLPTSNIQITFKILTHSDELKINQELEGLRKIDPKGSFELSTRLKYMIASINNDYENKTIREFVDNAFLARDAKAFREYVNQIAPGLDLKFTYSDENEAEKEAALPIGLNFFWPDF
jgi:hypothetical protein